MTLTCRGICLYFFKNFSKMNSRGKKAKTQGGCKNTYQFHRDAMHVVQCDADKFIDYIPNEKDSRLARVRFTAKSFGIFNVQWQWYNQRSGAWSDFTNTEIHKHLDEYKAGEDSLFVEVDQTLWEIRSFSLADCLIPQHYIKDIAADFLLTDHNTQLQYLVRKPTTSAVDQWHASAKQAGLGNNEDKGVELELFFPTDFPNNPPFVRVVKPRFQFHTGHITVGGSICTELLTTGTNEGWCKHKDTQSEPGNLFNFLHNLFIDGQAQVDLNTLYEYTVAEAKDAFKRVAAFHNW
jgi:ubiquitin-protein ligase